MKSEPAKSEPFKRFEALTKRLLHVPKKELEKKEAEWKARKNGDRSNPAP